MTDSKSIVDRRLRAIRDALDLPEDYFDNQSRSLEYLSISQQRSKLIETFDKVTDNELRLYIIGLLLELSKLPTMG